MTTSYTHRLNHYYCDPTGFVYTNDYSKNNVGFNYDCKLVNTLTIDLYYLHKKRFRFTESNKHKYFEIDKSGMIKIKADYAWNRANFPAINDNQNLFASLIHDVICQAVEENGMAFENRKIGDEIFYCLMLDKAKNNFQKLRAWYSYQSVSMYRRYLNVKRKI